MKSHGRSTTKRTGGRRRANHKKRKHELGNAPTETTVGEQKLKVVETRGGNTKVRAIEHDTATVIKQAMDAMLANDSEEATRLATEAHDAVATVDERVRETDALLLDLEPQQAQLLGLVVDSLSRAGDYGGNIAEAALQKAAPSP